MLKYVVDRNCANESARAAVFIKEGSAVVRLIVSVQIID